MSKNFQFRLFLVSIVIHLFFYISTNYTNTLNIFYTNINVGQDFFQIPNGVYAFLHGGKLTGVLASGGHAYVNCCGVNYNVYHPLFTFLIGYPLLFFTPWIALKLWTIVHLLVTVFIVYFLWKKFRHHKYLYLALSLFLLNSYHYYEIWHAQYHFLFNLFTLLFINESLSKGDTKKAGVWFFLSLLVKPIGLLWVIPLLMYRQFKTVFIGFGTFALITLLVNFLPSGSYYIRNFLDVSTTPIVGTNNIYGLTLLFPAFPLVALLILRTTTFVFLIVFQYIKRPPLFRVIALWICFQLLFYPLVYVYQVTTLASIFCLGILLNQFKPTKLLMIPIIFLTLPTIVIFYHLMGIEKLGITGLTINWLYTVFWIFWLAIAIVISAKQPSKKKVLSSNVLEES